MTVPLSKFVLSTVHINGSSTVTVTGSDHGLLFPPVELTITTRACSVPTLQSRSIPSSFTISSGLNLYTVSVENCFSITGLILPSITSANVADSCWLSSSTTYVHDAFISLSYDTTLLGVSVNTGTDGASDKSSTTISEGGP